MVNLQKFKNKTFSSKSKTLHQQKYSINSLLHYQMNFPRKVLLLSLKLPVTMYSMKKKNTYKIMNFSVTSKKAKRSMEYQE